MQYIIMKQIDINTWVSSLNSTDPVFVYTTLPEAQTKLAELEANNPSGRAYKVESYPDGSEI